MAPINFTFVLGSHVSVCDDTGRDETELRRQAAAAHVVFV